MDGERPKDRRRQGGRHNHHYESTKEPTNQPGLSAVSLVCFLSSLETCRVTPAPQVAVRHSPSLVRLLVPSNPSLGDIRIERNFQRCTLQPGPTPFTLFVTGGHVAARPACLPALRPSKYAFANSFQSALRRRPRPSVRPPAELDDERGLLHWDLTRRKIRQMDPFLPLILEDAARQ